jgi:hypothetical protein
MKYLSHWQMLPVKVSRHSLAHALGVWKIHSRRTFCESIGYITGKKTKHISKLNSTDSWNQIRWSKDVVFDKSRADATQDNLTTTDVIFALECNFLPVDGKIQRYSWQQKHSGKGKGKLILEQAIKAQGGVDV